MKTPYEILDVAADANDAEIKQAYLRKVKATPPDRNQERFQLIHNAYQSIKDNKSRVNYALFNIDAVDFDELLDRALDTTQNLRLDPEQLSRLLRISIDHKTNPNAKSHAEKP